MGVSDQPPVSPPPPAPAPAPIKPTSPSPSRHNPARIPALIVTAAIVVTVILSVWYLVRPEPLLIQGEADATRTDIAARVDGRIADLAVARGDGVAAGARLLAIDNPELIARLAQAEADKAVADAELARIDAGTRAEEIAVRKAAVDSANAALVLAQQTYQRTKGLAAGGNSPLQRLDETTAQLEVANRTADQARLAYQEAVAGYTKEDRQIAAANVAKAAAAIATLQALVDQLVVTAPTPGQVYQINTEAGEVVAPGVPLLSLIDERDVWFRFELREDLMKGIKVGDRFDLRVPALGDRKVAAEIKVIASRGEYSGWRATRATGDFDLRTFEIRAYPVEPLPDLRPGMSAYADWRGFAR
ncbi:MAG TPA: efflux RND transporter periplasmic adaptor subunit [Dongiaceae bacterium]|jgi:HlyD family secretion protein|nr:efflux RND transporter periplasmic adaptor subunit [Dongiaceae bacterium]